MEHMCGEDLVVNCAGRRFAGIAELFQDTTDRLHRPCRLQIGSYTCGNYFLGLLDWLERGPLPESPGGYDLVIPVLSESQLEKFLPRITSPAVREAQNVVVNDWGMLRLFSGGRRVRLGRLLFRDYRDHRYPAYEACCQPKSGALTAALRALQFEFTAIENDLITKEHGAAEEAAAVYYHFPYRQVSCSHICEFASIGKAVEEKFVPDDGCEFQCFGVSFWHGNEYLKVGRNVFDIVPESWLSAVKRPRIIYTPRWQHEHYGPLIQRG